ncbi:MAG: DNA polymerase/3'-5' exonuclease PolX [Endomicrobiia bacterium]
MKNHDIAVIFSKIAQYLHLLDENIFKIRAYEKATQIIENFPLPIEKFKDNVEELQSLPGIGRSIAEKIIEYLNTGKIEYYEELKKIFPESLLEIMSIPGMGPKRTRVLYEKLGIDNVEMLKEYAKKGILEKLEGFGKKVVKNILEGIEFKEVSNKQFLYSESIEFAEEIVRYLKSEDILNLDICGSFRRKKEVVGDLDILCCTKKGKESSVIKKFIEMTNIKKILAQGETKASVIIEKDFQVDLRVVLEESYGSSLQYFTGSKEHNIKLREYALQRGYSISEYGVFNAKNKKYVCGKKEQEIYKILGLEYIVPELRENRGEIEFAREHKLPKLLELKNIKGDTHIHSNYSDGVNSIREITFFAEKMGYEWIIICDHSKSLKVANGLEEKDLYKKIGEIEQINKTSKIKILCGAEVDILSNGNLDYSDDILSKIDFVIAAIHTGFKQSEEQITERIIRAMENKYVHAISHPTGRLLLKRDAYKVDIAKIVEVAKKYNVLLEINAYPDRLDLNDINVKYAKENGIKFSIGTDAHDVNHLNYIVYGTNVARRGWLEKDDVINTMSYDQLKKFLKNKR